MYYLFHGDDTFTQRERLNGLLAQEGDPEMLSLNTTHLGPRTTFAELQQAAGALPFLSRVRIVIVEDLFSGIPDKAFMEKLEEYLPDLPATTRLFFMESRPLPDNHRIIRLAHKDVGGHVLKFSTPKGGELDQWIMQQVAEREGRITPRAAQLLAANAGSDLYAMSNEIEKLVLYKGQEAEIDVADVTLLSPYVAEASIFDLVDALGGRQAATAADLFQQKLNEGAEPFYLFSMFIRQFRLLIQVKELAEGGARPPDIAAQLRVPPFVAGKLSQQSRSFSMSQLEQIYGRLLQIDVDAKTGKADLLTALHLLVAGLTLEA